MVKGEQDLRALETSVLGVGWLAKVKSGKLRLLCGARRERAPLQLPGGLQRGCEGIKIIGAYLGSEG